MGKRFDLLTPVVENICLIGKYYRLRVYAPEIAERAKPGQFCMIRAQYSGDSLLRRPFSIAAVRDEKILEFAYTTIGRGTSLLSRCEADDNIYCLGPLGNNFPIPETGLPVIIAGGIGIAPFPFFGGLLNQQRHFPITYYGARSSDELIYLEELNQLSEELHVATDDGSAGFHGFVTQLVEQHQTLKRKKVTLYSCGPHGMLMQVKRIAEKFGVPAYLSMEEFMGCGVGICIGCPIPAITKEGTATNYLCCKDGPIFPSNVVTL
jgi:dihydroorotate dehydrogenase electron transfer subunit